MQLMAKLGGGEIRNVAQRRFVSEKTKKKKWGEKATLFLVFFHMSQNAMS